jgi:hypothetical protein
MKRTYLALSGLLLAGSALPAAVPTLARAAGLFASRPVDASRFAVLARPVGESEWNLLVLEQLASAPRCWTALEDGLIDPSLNRFDYTGVCSRYLDSNGYSLRIGEQDLATSYRLRLQQQGRVLLLQALSPNEPTVLVVGRAEVPRRDRDAFVAIQLDPGWELQRRSFGEQSLNHLYFANPSPLRQLIAQAGSGQPTQPSRRPGPSAPLAGLPPAVMPATVPAAVMPSQARLVTDRPLRQPLDTARRRPLETPATTPGLGETGTSGAEPGRTIALQVIPFQE